jgi:hypothetical protein
VRLTRDHRAAADVARAYHRLREEGKRMVGGTEWKGE